MVDKKKKTKKKLPSPELICAAQKMSILISPFPPRDR
jgi:hypothetical protein